MAELIVVAGQCVNMTDIRNERRIYNRVELADLSEDDDDFVPLVNPQRNGVILRKVNCRQGERMLGLIIA